MRVLALCVCLVGLGHAMRRVVRGVRDEGLDLSFVEVDGRTWRNDFNDEYWIARVENGCISMTPQPDSMGESIGIPYDSQRVLNLYGAWSDAQVPEPAGYVEADKLFSTLQLFGAEYYHMHVETLPKLVLAKKLLESEPELKVLMYRPKPYARRFLQLLDMSDSSLLFAMSNPGKNGDAACASEGRCVDYRAKMLFLPSPAHQFSPSGQVLGTTRDFVYSLLSPPAKPEPTQIVVLSRNNTRSRRWLNEEACVAALRLAFPDERVVVFPDTGLPSDEMVRLFASSKVVLGPHGGGFASIMFAPMDAAIVEIDCDGKSIAYKEVARQMGQRYIGLRGNFSWESPTATVPEAQLVDAVRRALDGEGDRQFPPAHLQELRAQQQESRRQTTLMPPE